MPKKITISLRGIVEKIDKAQVELKEAKKIANLATKQSLTVKIQNLQNIKEAVVSNCPKGKSSFNIVVLPGTK
jgi:hypothetical protein